MLYIDEIDPNDFDRQWLLVQKILNPPTRNYCLAENRRGYPCASAPLPGGSYCKYHERTMS